MEMLKKMYFCPAKRAIKITVTAAAFIFDALESTLSFVT